MQGQFCLMIRRVSGHLPSAVIAGTLWAIALAGPALALDSGARWSRPDTFVSRLEMLAVLQTFNAELLSNPSATRTLDRWCRAHDLAPEGETIVADRVHGEDKTATEDIRALLQVASDEPVAYRRVRLRCGERVLSEADNWYVPSRLASGMSELLNTSDVPFGRVVQALGFSRSTLSAKLLWRPLPEGWETGAELPARSDVPLALPPFLLEHRAVLKLPNGTPFSALVETYTRDVLDFQPRTRAD